MAKKLLCVIGSLSASAAVISVANRPTTKCIFTENEKKQLNIKKAVEQARKLTCRLKDEVGAPAIIVGVSVDGEVVWKEGIGYADLENEVPAHEDTVIRIASISKSLTAAVVGLLWQEGKIDIDQPIQKYVPNFPEKTYGNEKVVITTRQLMCHLSGIRHYLKKKKVDSVASGDGQLEEFYSKERCESIEKALSIFKDDELLHSPGSKFLYTTYGWTVISAVMEGATGRTYPQLMRTFLRKIGMRRTYLDEPEPIIYGRSKCYSKNKNGRIINSPYVDNSCKWAGGGFLSTVGDLLKFANAMLFAFQSDGDIDVSKQSQMLMIKEDKIDQPKLSKQNDSSLKSIDQDTGERIEQSKVKQVEGESYMRSGAKSVMQGIGSGGSYVWGMATSLFSKKTEDSESPSKGSKVEDESYIRSGAKSIMQGIGSGGSYVWGMATSLFSKKTEDSESPSKGSKVEDESYIHSGAGNVLEIPNKESKLENKSYVPESQNKDSKVEDESYMRSGAKSIMQGIGSRGSYVWGMATSLFSKKTEDSESPSKGSKVEDESYIRSGANSIMQGIGSGGSYVWGLATSLFSKENDDKGTPEKESSLETQSVVKSTMSSAYSAGLYLWKKATFASDQKDEEEKKSWMELLKDVFKPRALVDDEKSMKTNSEGDSELSFLLVDSGRRKDFWFDHVLPYAVGVVLRQTQIKTAEFISDDGNFETTDKFRNSFGSKEINLNRNNKPYVMSSTMVSLWTRVDGTRLSDWGPHIEGGYGLGFGVAQAIDSAGGVPDGGQPYIVGHTGGAVGASSAMIIVPKKCNEDVPPKGVAVVLLTNLQGVSLNPLAIEISRIFANLVT